MWTHEFAALGTHWHLSVDQDSVRNYVVEEIHTATADFEKKYSRFVQNNQVTRWKDSNPGTYTVDSELAKLLTFAQELKQKSRGLFDPAVGSLLEHAGYNQSYSFSQNAPEIEQWQLPRWSIEGTALTITDPLIFDLGGFAKGYWIDQVSQLLLSRNAPNHLVDGGGDMYGTTKIDGTPWNIAIEYPGKSDTAIGTITLQNQGFAASDIFRRSWKNWHHLVNIPEKKPQHAVLGAVAVASSAMHADGMTALLTLSLPESYPNYYSENDTCEYLVLSRDNQLFTSPAWPGKIFR